MRSKAIRSTEHLQDIAPRGSGEQQRISSRNGGSRPLLDSRMKSFSVELSDEAGGGGDGGDNGKGGAPQPSAVRRPRRQGSRGTGGASVESPSSSSTSFMAASASQRPFGICSSVFCSFYSLALRARGRERSKIKALSLSELRDCFRDIFGIVAPKIKNRRRRRNTKLQDVNNN